MPDMPNDLNDHPVRANRGIVTVVVILGALIVLGLGGLVYGIAMKAGNIGSSDVSPKVELENTGVSAAPPIGTHIMSMTADSGRLYLHLRLVDGREIVQAYDASGEKIYEIVTFSVE